MAADINTTLVYLMDPMVFIIITMLYITNEASVTAINNIDYFSW